MSARDARSKSLIASLEHSPATLTAPLVELAGVRDARSARAPDRESRSEQ